MKIIFRTGNPTGSVPMAAPPTQAQSQPNYPSQDYQGDHLLLEILSPFPSKSRS